jgi:hypothetical protein
VLALGEKQPVVLVVEDLHWLDPASDEVLDALVQTPLLPPVIATARLHEPGVDGEKHVTRLACAA